MQPLNDTATNADKIEATAQAAALGATSADLYQAIDPLPGNDLLEDVHHWLGTYIKPAQPEDLDILTLWIVHTHLVRETYTTPRLLLDSPKPGAGKTTVLDHMQRLAFNPVQAASLSSPSLLARLLQKSPRTILIDEADRTLNPKADGVGELLAVLNSGYRFGASRPVLTPDKEEGWTPVEMSTFGPVAMAGNAPDLPDDTRSRCIRVMLLPDTDGVVEDSDWQFIEDDALEIHADIEKWANSVRDTIATSRPEYPHGLRGRNRERWAPLYKVSLAAGGDWPARCERLIESDMEEQQLDREAGIEKRSSHVDLLTDVAAMWSKDTEFMATEDILRGVKITSPQRWTEEHKWGELTAQAFGRMMVKHFSIRSVKPTSGDRRRGYRRSQFVNAWRAFGIS